MTDEFIDRTSDEFADETCFSSVAGHWLSYSADDSDGRVNGIQKGHFSVRVDSGPGNESHPWGIFLFVENVLFLVAYK